MVTPIFDYVLIDPKEKETMVEGYHVAEESVDTPYEGTVVKKGKRFFSKVRVGDTVLFKKWGGTEVGDQLLIKEEDILAILKE